MSYLKRIKEEKKMIGMKFFTKYIRKRMILENL